MVTLFADRKRNRQAVARRWKRAGGVRRIGAWRILEMIEIEHQFPGLIEAVGREGSVQEAARLIRCAGTRCVAKNEKEFGLVGILKHRLETIGSAVEGEFCSTGNRLLDGCANQSG